VLAAAQGDLYKDKSKSDKPASAIGKQFSGGILIHQKSRVFPGCVPGVRGSASVLAQNIS